MISSPCSPTTAAARLLVMLALTGGLVGSLADDASAEAPGQQFIAAVGERIAMREIPCTDLPDLPGQVRCAEVQSGAAVFRAAHDEAMVLAARELPVLDVRLQNGVPPNQLAELPGLEPVPDLPGLAHRLYLIAESRVGIWIDLETRDGEQTRIYFTVEPLSGPFPDYFPAVEK